MSCFVTDRPLKNQPNDVGVRLGIELVNRHPDGHNGTSNGQYYFECKPGTLSPTPTEASCNTTRGAGGGGAAADVAEDCRAG
jgi:hypothetical protein